MPTYKSLVVNSIEDDLTVVLGPVDDNVSILNLYVTGAGALLTSVVISDFNNSTVEIDAQGSVTGNSQSSLDTISLVGKDDSLLNDGTILGSTGSSGVDYTAVQLATASDDVISNNGYIGGETAISFGNAGFNNGADANQVVNAGTIAGQQFAIDTGGNTNSLVIENSGDITSAGLSTSTLAGSALHFNDGSSVVDSIINTGKISAPDFAIVSEDDALDISNSGSIQGGLDLENNAAAVVDNAGVWQAGDDGLDGLQFDGASDDSLTNSGTITGAVAFTGGGRDDRVTNSGAIEGALDLSSDPVAVVDNASGGKITDGVSVAAGGKVENAGAIDDDVTLTGGDGQFDNTGEVAGAVSLGGGDNTFANAGTVTGALQVGASGTGKDSIANSGALDGGVSISAANPAYGAEQFVNDATGSVAGGVSITGVGATDNFQNFGEISGAVTLENGPFDNGGEIDGQVTVNSDNETIYNFGAIDGDDSPEPALFLHGAFGKDTVINSGEIAGGIGFDTNSDSLFNWSTGIISSKIAGYAVGVAGYGFIMKNVGRLDGSVLVNGGADAVWNWGAVAGSLNLGASDDAITNNGTIEGAVTLRGDYSRADKLHNRGEIEGGVAMAASADEYVVNALSGAVAGGVTFNGTHAMLRNRGAIDGDASTEPATLGVSMQSGDDTLINRGSIDDGVSFLGADLGHDYLLNGPTGILSGGVIFGGNDDTLANRGGIDGQYSTSEPGSTMLSGADTVFNRGEIDGGFGFIGATAKGGDAFYNSVGGAVDDGLSFAGAGDVLINRGVIDSAPLDQQGVSILSGGDYLQNDDLISGEVTFTAGASSGGDQLYNGAGATITGGVVMSGNNSTFDNLGDIAGDASLSGNADSVYLAGTLAAVSLQGNGDVVSLSNLFGEQTIYGFNSTDTLILSSNDFADVAAVQAAMSQATGAINGADTIIRLDANDSITFVGVTEATVNAAKFEFL